MPRRAAQAIDFVAPQCQRGRHGDQSTESRIGAQRLEFQFDVKKLGVHLLRPRLQGGGQQHSTVGSVAIDGHRPHQSQHLQCGRRLPARTDFGRLRITGVHRDVHDATRRARCHRPPQR